MWVTYLFSNAMKWTAATVRRISAILRQTYRHVVHDCFLLLLEHVGPYVTKRMSDTPIIKCAEAERPETTCTDDVSAIQSRSGCINLLWNFRPVVICTKNKDSRAQRRHVFTKSSDALRGSRRGKGVGDCCFLRRDSIGQVTCLSITLFLLPPIFLSISLSI
jgi:hypothetical protein